MHKLTIMLVILCCFLGIFTYTVHAQATDGNLVGAVQDASHAGIPGANIELVSMTTGVVRVAVTDAYGLYRYNNLPAGLYKLTVKAPGFSSSALEGIAIDLNTTTTANLGLRVEAMATQVEVTEAPALIDTTTAQIASIFGTRQALDLPIATLPLGVMNLSLLSAGVASGGGVGLGEGPSIGGQRPRNNNFTVEGVDNNRKDATGHSLFVPNEAVAEFTVLQNQFSAEFGHSTGGQFNTIVHSGGNEVHGSLYEYFQNRNLNAVDQSAARQGILANPRYDQNLLGATIGGPVIKNKLFYFGDFEYNPYGQATTAASATSAPTAAGYQMLSSMPGISQTNLGVLKQYVSPAAVATGATSVNGVAIPIGILPIQFPSYQNTYNWVASVDYTISSRDQLRGRYLGNDVSGVDPQVSPNLPAFSQIRTTTAKLVTVSEFHNFSPNVLNEFRLAYNRFHDSIPSGNFKFPGLDAFPNIQINQDLNLQLGPYSQSPQATVLGTYEVVDNLSYTRGRHTLKFGFDGRKYIAPDNFISRVRGDYQYTNLERYLLDLNPDEAALRNPTGVPFSGNQLDAYWYVNDDYRLRRNLSINLGLRYEYKGVAAGYKLQELNAIADVPGLIDFRAPRAQTKDFAPRVGLAWSPGQSGTTSIRAGFGMGYDVLFDNFGENAKPPELQSTVSLNIHQNISDFLKNGGIPVTAQTGALTQAQARASTAYFIPDQRLPYSIQWNLGVQHVFRHDYTVEVRYVGTRGVHLYVQNQLDIFAPVTATNNLPTYLAAPTQAQLAGLPLTLGKLAVTPILAPYLNAGFRGPITTFLSSGNSIYHGLATEVTRRFARGLMFKGAYTWSHNIDDSTADLASTLLTPRRAQDGQNLGAERATSMLDRRQRLTLTSIWDAPWFAHHGNWFERNLIGNLSFAGNYTAESPEFATVQSGTDSNLNRDSAGDRTIINPAGNANIGSDVTAYNAAGHVVKFGDPSTVAYVANDPTARYIKAGPGAYANGGRNTLPLRGINNFDLAAIKRFSITESKKLEFRAMFFNAFNHPQYTPGSINTVQSVARVATRNNLIPGNPIFNDPTQVYESNARNITLAARLTF
jgi:hypothetical protein